MLHCDFDGGLDLCEMMAIDLCLADLTDEFRTKFISEMKNEEPEVWDEFVAVKKWMGDDID